MIMFQRELIVYAATESQHWIHLTLYLILCVNKVKSKRKIIEFNIVDTFLRVCPFQMFYLCLYCKHGLEFLIFLLNFSSCKHLPENLGFLG